MYLEGCALSGATELSTPLGPLAVDAEVLGALHATGKFEVNDQDVDEAEHSLEMQMPYIKSRMGDAPFTVVPIMVGSLSVQREREYGELLAPYLADPCNFFVISSDFCHWGSRFGYQPYDPSAGERHEFIRGLDQQGMDHIASKDADSFHAYLRRTRNTICGRHPIAVLLRMVEALGKDAFDVDFTCYNQSSAVVSPRDSSVSYASAVVRDLREAA